MSGIGKGIEFAEDHKQEIEDAYNIGKAGYNLYKDSRRQEQDLHHHHKFGNFLKKVGHGIKKAAPYVMEGIEDYEKIRGG